MANCHDQFYVFHGKIEQKDTNKTRLQQAREAIRDLIRNNFRKNNRMPVPSFHSQGSFDMHTIVTPLDGNEFDLDDGIYLQHLDRKSDVDWPTPETVHTWICNAVNGHTKKSPIDKRTCVRLVYAGEYHIDLPIYADLNGVNMHAEKGERGWHSSDPVEITKWFQNAIETCGEQLRRVVRYLKAWADCNAKDGNLPNGLILTVLAVQNFRGNDRDDICLADTVDAIRNSISNGVFVRNPVDSAEELTSRLDDGQKKRFQVAITNLVEEGKGAIELAGTSKASKIWQKQFGDRFPVVEDESREEQQKKADADRLASVYVARASKPWMSIT